VSLTRNIFRIDAPSARKCRKPKILTNLCFNFVPFVWEMRHHQSFTRILNMWNQDENASLVKKYSFAYCRRCLIFTDLFWCFSGNIFLKLNRSVVTGDDVILEGIFRNKPLQTRFFSDSKACAAASPGLSPSKVSCQPLVLKFLPRRSMVKAKCEKWQVEKQSSFSWSLWAVVW